MTDERSYEDAQKELERVVAQLERGQADLEDAVALWERGEQLYRYCAGRLDVAQAKIDELGRRVEETRP